MVFLGQRKVTACVARSRHHISNAKTGPDKDHNMALMYSISPDICTAFCFVVSLLYHPLCFLDVCGLFVHTLLISATVMFLFFL